MARDGYCHEAAVPAAALGCLRRSGTRFPACAPSPQCWHFFFFFLGGEAHKPRESPPLGGLQEAGLAAWPQSGFCWGSHISRLGCRCPAGLWAAGKLLGGAWQPPNVGKGPGATRGAARELAGPQQPSSRGGGGVVITHSLQPNQPSFVANSSPQARMGFISPPISLKCNSFHQNLVSHEAYNEFYVYLKWSDIRHPIILTPREKHGLNV